MKLAGESSWRSARSVCSFSNGVRRTKAAPERRFSARIEHRLADRKLKQLTQRLITSQEEERSRLSRELHDGISQLLVSIKFQFELASRELGTGKPSAGETLREGTQRLAAAIGEIRRISHDLHPSLLDTLGLPAALGQLVEEFRQRSGLDVGLESYLDLA